MFIPEWNVCYVDMAKLNESYYSHHHCPCLYAIGFCGDAELNT